MHFSIAEMPREIIDEINILYIMCAMEKAAREINIATDHLYIDGNCVPAHLPARLKHC